MSAATDETGRLFTRLVDDERDAFVVLSKAIRITS